MDRSSEVSPVVTVANHVREVKKACEDATFLVEIVGLPGSGKSTFAKNLFHELYSDDSLGYFPWRIASSDDLVDTVANFLDSTYNEVWPLVVKLATRKKWKTAERWIREDQEIVVHVSTNITPWSRNRIVPAETTVRIGVYFDVPFEKILERNCREGKIIPLEVLEDMWSRLVPPSESEYDMVFTFRQES